MRPGELQNVRRVAAALIVFAPTVSTAEPSTCPSAGTSVQLAAVEPRLDLRLADGRLVRLAGLEPAAATHSAPGRADAARSALAGLVQGHALTISVLTEKPDRWGRIDAFVFRADDPTPGGLGVRAIAAGLARYLPETIASPCRAELLAAEASARAAMLGLWRDPYYSVLAVDDRAAFAERAGTNVVVEARLAAVEPGPYRTTLRFATPTTGTREGRRLAATIVPRAMKTFEARGVDFSSLIGRTLRLRGLLDRRFGPRIELTRPDEIEVLPDASARTK